MKSTVVCDAGPINALGGSGHIELLRHLFDHVIVPHEVSEEIMAWGEQAMGARAFQQATWLDILPTPTAGVETLLLTLDSGEASVIATASKINNVTVLIDEFAGRRVASNVYTLKVAGTGRVLLEAKRRNLISKVRPALDEMRANGYWMTDKVVAAILTEATE